MERNNGLDDANGRRNDVVVAMTAVNWLSSRREDQKVFSLRLPFIYKLF